VPIVAVLGNHEFYGRCWSEEVAQTRRVAPLYGVHLLENDAAVIGRVRFLGCTLWTDYELYGPPNLPLAMRSAATGLTDHRRILWSKTPQRPFRPQEALLLHRRSRAFIEQALAASHEGPTVVVTHHAPHPGSLEPRYRDDLLSAAFASDLGPMIAAGRAALWIHGHVHASCDYRVGATRIVANPHGYEDENTGFDPALIVEVGS